MNKTKLITALKEAAITMLIIVLAIIVIFGIVIFLSGLLNGHLSLFRFVALAVSIVTFFAGLTFYIYIIDND